MSNLQGSDLRSSTPELDKARGRHTAAGTKTNPWSIRRRAGEFEPLRGSNYVSNLAKKGST